jgi:hypothetical protein
MRRRWRRRDDGGSENRRSAIDAARICQELAEAGVGGATSLTPLALEGLPGERAVLAEGLGADSSKLLVGYAPHDGMDALLAALAAPGAGVSRVAVAPRWSNAALRVIEGVKPGISVRALVGAAGEEVDATPLGRGSRGAPLPASRVIDGIADPIRREMFGRAVAALEGLAAKHGGGLRGFGERVELVVLARTAAVLRDSNGVALEIHLGERSTVPLGPGDLPDAMDRLEGALRRRLADRKARSSEEELRAGLAGRAAAALGARSLRLWPLGGGALDVIDFAAVGDDGVPLLGALREELSLAALADVLSAAFGAAPALPGLLAQVAPPVRFSEIRVAIAAQRYAGAALAALDALALPLALVDIDPSLSPPELRRRAEAAAVELRATPLRSAPPRPRESEVRAPEIAAEPAPVSAAGAADPWRRAAAGRSLRLRSRRGAAAARLGRWRWWSGTPAAARSQARAPRWPWRRSARALGRGGARSERDASRRARLLRSRRSR